jgi:hypothetical protein
VRGLGIVVLTALFSIRAAACEVDVKSGSTSVNVADSLQRFDDIEKRLKKGLSLILTHEVYVEENRPLAKLSCKVFYDLWDETYHVARFSQTRPEPEFLVLKGYQSILEPCFRVEIRGALASQLSARSVYSQVTQEQVEKTKKWLSEKGIGSKSATVIGRAVDAMIDYDRAQIFDRRCSGVRNAN